MQAALRFKIAHWSDELSGFCHPGAQRLSGWKKNVFSTTAATMRGRIARITAPSRARAPRSLLVGLDLLDNRPATRCAALQANGTPQMLPLVSFYRPVPRADSLSVSGVEQIGRRDDRPESTARYRRISLLYHRARTNAGDQQPTITANRGPRDKGLHNRLIGHSPEAVRIAGRQLMEQPHACSRMLASAPSTHPAVLVPVWPT